MSYLVFARKYRPRTFEEMIGQKAIVKTLQNAIKNERVAQAYIFSGMRGVGKTTAARILAKALNCREGPAPVPCNRCDYCLEINEDRSLDVIEIDGASNTSVDDVRSLREGVQYKPLHCRYKIIIIDEIHMLSKSAFNALLKTLEEPPENTIFIFATTEFHKVPATIVSRCQHFEFKGIPQSEIVKHLEYLAKQENIRISQLGLNLVADAAEGSLRDAQSLLDQAVAFSGETIDDDDLKEILGTVNRDLLFRFSTAVFDEKADEIFSLVERVINSGYDLRFFHEELIRHFRNLLIVRSLKEPEDILPFESEDMERLHKEADKSTAEEILRYLTALQQGEQGLRFSTHPRIYLESLLVKMCHFKKVVPLQDLLQQVQALREVGGAKSSATSPPAPTLASEPSPPSASLEKHVPVAPPEQTKAAADAGREKPQKSQNKATEAALKDPAVQKFMDAFKAQIISVERKKDSPGTKKKGGTE